MLLKDIDIGGIIVDPGTAIYSEPIQWMVLDKNHPGYPDHSVTLISKNLLRMMSFDAKEPTNPTAHRQVLGNQNYAVSNLRQWLNSDEAVWFSAQTPYDAPPIAANLLNKVYAYENIPGFLQCCSAGFKQALLTTGVDYSHPAQDGGHTEALNDRIFLLSSAEVGLSGPVAEGSKFAYFTDNISRLAYPSVSFIANNFLSSLNLTTGTPYRYYLRTYNTPYPSSVFVVSATGMNLAHNAYDDSISLRPACNLKDSLEVVYSVEFGAYVPCFPSGQIPLWARDGGAWKRAEAVFVRNAGAWAKAKEIRMAKGN